MPNYSLVINSKFKPFSYQELLQPALMSTQAHQAVEEAYADLATKANIWDKMTEPGSKAHSMYEAYSQDLEKYADRLARYGLTPSDRQAMLNMRSRYSTDIVPIEQAYKRREEQAKEQAKIMASDPTHFFARQASTTSLDDYIANPSLDTLTQNYSGALLTQQVANAASALAKDARNDPKVQTELRKLLPYQYEAIRRTGFDPETVRQAILNSPDADKILTGIVDTAMANSGMNDWNYISPEDKERILAQARNYANQGLWSAVGQTQYNMVTDQYGMHSALEATRHSNAMKEAAAKNGDPTGTGNPKYRMIANTRVQGDTSKLKEDLEFLQSIGDGKISKLSKEKRKSNYGPATRMYLGQYGIHPAEYEPSEYDVALNRYKSIAKKYGLSPASWGPNVHKTLVDRINKDIRSNVTRAMTYQMNMTDQSQLAQILEENSNTMFRGNRNRSGLRMLNDDGTVGSQVTAEEAGEIFGEGKGFNFSYDPTTGYLLSFRDKDNKFRTAIVDPELINFGGNDYTRAHNYVQQYLNHGQTQEAQDLIDEMMTSLYYRFNTQGVKQSATGKVE